MRLVLPALVATWLCACAAPPVPPAGPAPGRAAARLATATVEVAPARGYGLTAADGGTVHRWVPADVLAYEVRLARAGAGDAYDLPAARLLTLAAKGPAASSRAVFADVAFGARYRAFVTAFGNPGGVLADGGLAASDLRSMTAAAATVDFDLTAAEPPSEISRPVQVVLDAVPFAGAGTIRFGAPADATWVPPGQGVTAEARP